LAGGANRVAQRRFPPFSVAPRIATA